MKKAVLVFLAFFVLSIGLAWIWEVWLRNLYGELFKSAALVLHGWLGLGEAPIAPYRTRYINLVPFVSLILVTPGISPRRRAVGLGLGLVAIFVSHLALNLTAYFTPGAAVPIVPALFSDTLPFLLWLGVAYPAIGGLFGVSQADAESDGESSAGS